MTQVDACPLEDTEKSSHGHYELFLSLFMLMFLLMLLFRSLWFAWAQQVGGPEKAAQRAEIVAYQLAHLFQTEQGKNQDLVMSSLLVAGGTVRAPSSVRNVISDSTLSPVLSEGELGEDPWGRPYVYKISKIKEKGSYLWVLSRGRNGLLENKWLVSGEGFSRGALINQIKAIGEKGIHQGRGGARGGALQLHGDDVGFLISLGDP